MFATLAGLSILVIGDSHLRDQNYLLGTLHDELLGRGAKVHTIGVCGSTPADWVTTKAGDCGGAERIDKGTITYTEASAKTKPVKQLIDPVGKAQSRGGHHGRHDWGLQATHLSPCMGLAAGHGVDQGDWRHRRQVRLGWAGMGQRGRQVRQNLRSIDGQHFTPTGYKEWGKAIAKAIATSPAVKK